MDKIDLSREIMEEPDLGETIGIIRHLDNVGRIVIPREIRKSLSLEEDDALEIFATENGVFMKKKEN